jgi:AraC-like DNA-binding protein
MRSAEIQHREVEPDEELRNIIKCFWYDKRDFGMQESGFEVVPDGNAEIIFHFGSGCSISRNGVLKPLPSPFMIGLLNKPVSFYAKDILEIIAIRCFPWTVFDLLGLPSGRDGVRTLAHPIARLHSVLETFIRAARIEEATTYLNDYFLDTHSKIASDSMLFKAGAAMREANGTLAVSQVAQAAHATVRTLERRFRKSSGHSVKDVSGLIRFEQVRNHLWMHPEANLAGLAHEMGYTDQSHLTREFKRFSGTTPAAFARNAKRSANIDLVAFT